MSSETNMWSSGNPVMYVDPEGLSTAVLRNEDGTYAVNSVDLNDGDLGIYVYYQDSEGNYTVRGEKIGVTPTLYSFYNCDEGLVVNAIINPNDFSGDNFLKEMKSGVNLWSYVFNKGRGGHIYDFKVSNNQEGVYLDSAKEQYRGMPIGIASGEIIYASARDIGNMGAGIVATTHGIPYSCARLAFDIYQTMQNGHLLSGRLDRELPGTASAELYGYLIGYSYVYDWFK